MTLDEKLSSSRCSPTGRSTDADAAKAGVGGVFSLTDPAQDRPVPARSRSSSRGCTSRSCSRSTRSTATGRSSRSRSATASSFDPSVAPTDHTIGARESATVGIKQIYSPMVDVSHEPRWGRISEGGGEDPYLGSVMARPRASRARRATTTARPTRSSPSVKHFAAYGQPEGGRDYNTTDMSRAAAAQPLPAAVQGRDRRRRRHRDVLVQRDQRRARAARTSTPRPTSSRRSGASTASSRATTRRSPSCAPARRRARRGPVRPRRRRRRRRTRARTRSTPAPTPRWSRPTIRDYGKQLLAQHRISMTRHRRRRAPDPARSSSAPGCSTTRTSTTPRPTTAPASCPRRPHGGPQGRRRARWCCSRTTATRCRSTRQEDRA